MSKTNNFPILQKIAKEYLDKSSKLTSGNSPFEKTVAANWEPTITLFQKIEKTLSLLPDLELKKLEKKFNNILSKAKSWNESYNDQFFDLLIEILGCGYLLHNGYSASFSDTPDIIGEKNKVKIMMECKNIHISNNERAYLDSTRLSLENILCRDVNELIALRSEENPFYRKLVSTIKKASQQMITAEEKNIEKIMFINFDFDTNIIPIKNKIIIDVIDPEANKLREIEQEWQNSWNKGLFTIQEWQNL